MVGQRGAQCLERRRELAAVVLRDGEDVSVARVGGFETRRFRELAQRFGAALLPDERKSECVMQRSRARLRAIPSRSTASASFSAARKR